MDTPPSNMSFRFDGGPKEKPCCHAGTLPDADTGERAEALPAKVATSATLLMQQGKKNAYQNATTECKHENGKTENRHGQILEYLLCGQRWRHMRCCQTWLEIGHWTSPRGQALSATPYKLAHVCCPEQAGEQSSGFYPQNSKFTEKTNKTDKKYKSVEIGILKKIIWGKKSGGFPKAGILQSQCASLAIHGNVGVANSAAAHPWLKVGQCNSLQRVWHMPCPSWRLSGCNRKSFHTDTIFALCEPLSTRGGLVGVD
eukprot:2700930-Amphidinium_carterae.1